MKGNRDNNKGRVMNVILCSMQLLAPLMANASLMITMGQEDLFSMIIKSYVTMGAICQIANQFAATLP